METNSDQNSDHHFICQKCDYMTAINKNYKRHLQTRKHLETKNSDQNSDHFFTCQKCDYMTAFYDDYKKHLQTRKHNGNISDQNSDQKVCNPENANKYACGCGNIFKNRSGLWKHKKTCSTEILLKEDTQTMTNLVVTLVKQNQDFQKQIFEMMKDNIGISHSNNNNTTTNNNKFNLNFFLNETCKDAMNLSEFVDSLKITLTDLENVGKLGYTEGISRIFTKGLKELEVNKRPIHCSDLKRETVYVKNENKWEKEGDQLRKAIKQITNKNIRLIPKWKEDNPGHQQYHNKKNDEYLKIMYESMGPTDELEETKSFAKIITNLAKETTILR